MWIGFVMACLTCISVMGKAAWAINGPIYIIPLPHCASQCNWDSAQCNWTSTLKCYMYCTSRFARSCFATQKRVGLRLGLALG